jgi:serine/threonine protein kinase
MTYFMRTENFLLKDKSDHAQIKIIDFGLSRKDDAPFGVMSSRVGTPCKEIIMESIAAAKLFPSVLFSPYVLRKSSQTMLPPKFC